MREATFIELRNSAKEFFDAVEAGVTVRVFRNGKPIAEVVLVRSTLPSWKRPAMPVTIKGVSLGQEIVIDRNNLKVFLDSSRAKRFVAENGSDEAWALCEEAEALIVSVICLPELISTRSRLVREKRLTKPNTGS